MSKRSKPLTVKLLRLIPRYQNLVIAFLLANSFSLGLGLLIGENIKSGGVANLMGSKYRTVTVEEIQASTQNNQPLTNDQIGTKISINKASLSELDSLPGVGPIYAQKITAGRPYQAALDLVTKKIIPLSLYNKIKDRISVE